MLRYFILYCVKIFRCYKNIYICCLGDKELVQALVLDAEITQIFTEEKSK